MQCSCGHRFEAPARFCPQCGRSQSGAFRSAELPTLIGDLTTLGLGTGEFLGRTIRGYAIHGVLGRGGMGTVFAARQLQLGREVALKVLAPDLSKRALLIERFRQEARLLAQIDNPHIIAIHDMFEEDALFWIVTSLAEGGSVRGLVGKNIAETRAAEIVRQAALGLWAAAEKGIVHRDIKPDNLLLTAGGRIKVGDFGLAKLEASDDALTQVDALLGSPAYSSPEHWDDCTTTGHASDLYALGCSLVELLTGAPPFPGPSFANLMKQHCYDPPPDLRARRPDLSDGILAVIARLLAKDPKERYPSGLELAEELGMVTGVHWSDSSETTLQAFPVLKAEILQAGGARPDMSETRVLVADDNAFNRRLLVRHVEAIGCQTLEARDGREALEILRGQAVDLLLLDILMPEVDGYEVLRQLQTPAYAKIPVVVVSALDDFGNVQTCLGLGADDYLVKPLHQTLLRNRLELALARTRQGDSGTVHRILLVDDDPDFCAWAETILALEGYEVTAGSDGPDALLALGGGSFDLLLCDVHLPGLDGFALLDILRAKDIGVPVLMMTGAGQVELEARALRLGAVDFITKPIADEIFQLRVRKALELARLVG